MSRLVRGGHCKMCPRTHEGACDPEVLERIKQQRNEASRRQFKLYSLCLNYVRDNHPEIYDKLAEEAGKKWYFNG